MIALNGLARDADGFILLSDTQVEQQMPVLAEYGLATTPSGGAGLVAAMSGLVPFIWQLSYLGYFKRRGVRQCAGLQQMNIKTGWPAPNR